jgi:hypothetical protein
VDCDSLNSIIKYKSSHSYGGALVAFCSSATCKTCTELAKQLCGLHLEKHVQI